MRHTRRLLAMPLVAALLVIGLSACGDDDASTVRDSGVVRIDSGGAADSGPGADTGTTGVDSGGSDVDGGGSDVDGGPAGMCAAAGESCAGGETCCRRLNCCAGVPIPPGEEYCALDCPREM